jgi:hypothetical protein
MVTLEKRQGQQRHDPRIHRPRGIEVVSGSVIPLPKDTPAAVRTAKKDFATKFYSFTPSQVNVTDRVGAPD